MSDVELGTTETRQGGLWDQVYVTDRQIGKRRLIATISHV